MQLKMLVAIAIGDAYGAGFEYAAPEFVQANHTLTGYTKHPKHNIVPGSYTDDTQMSIANALVICQGSVGREELAQAYVTQFHDDEREGYAGGFYKFLCATTSGANFLANISPYSDKSGGAMRALPFGIYPDVETVKSLAGMQAAITHNTTDGINAAVAAALMAHYFLYNIGPKADLAKFLESHVPGEWASWTGAVGAKGWMSVRAAVTAVIAGTSMMDILRRSIDFRGDVDTVAALALGAAAASPEVTQDISEALVLGLENGKYGRDYLHNLDLRLSQTMATLQQEQLSKSAALADTSADAQSSLPDSTSKPAAGPDVIAVSPRLLVVQSPELWTGFVNNPVYLQIPSTMDVASEERAWFAAGGNSSFADYLIAQGAIKVLVEVCNINYQS